MRYHSDFVAIVCLLPDGAVRTRNLVDEVLLERGCAPSGDVLFPLHVLLVCSEPRSDILGAAHHVCISIFRHSGSEDTAALFTF